MIVSRCLPHSAADGPCSVRHFSCWSGGTVSGNDMALGEGIGAGLVESKVLVEGTEQMGTSARFSRGTRAMAKTHVFVSTGNQRSEESGDEWPPSTCQTRCQTLKHKWQPSARTGAGCLVRFSCILVLVPRQCGTAAVKPRKNLAGRCSCHSNSGSSG